MRHPWPIIRRDKVTKYLRGGLVLRFDVGEKRKRPEFEKDIEQEGCSSL